MSKNLILFTKILLLTPLFALANGPDGKDLKKLSYPSLKGIPTGEKVTCSPDPLVNYRWKSPDADDDLEVYYNPDGGTSYHATATCRSVRDKYLPLTAFTYGELDSGKYASLTGCTNCIPVKRRAEIDEINQERIDLGELLKNPVYTGGATTGGGAQAEGSAASDSPEASDGVTITIR